MESSKDNHSQQEELKKGEIQEELKKGDDQEEKRDVDQLDEINEVEETSIVPQIEQKKKKVKPYLSSVETSWDNEEFKIPENIKKGIIEKLKWDRPSKIQKSAIPLIAFPDEETAKHENLIAQAKNGAGKSGAFVIGSLLRVDPSIEQVQVIVIGHVKELVSQIGSVFKSVAHFAPEYKICILDGKEKLDHKAQIVVSTFGQISASLSARKPLNLDKLRVFVLDEADSFFTNDTQRQDLNSFLDTLQKKNIKPQFIFFSATYENEVGTEIFRIVQDAVQIKLKIETLKLENIQQFYHKCKKGKKIDFIMNIFNSFNDNTQTIIFVNTKSFADLVYHELNKNKYRCFVMSSNLDKKERDDCIKQFREGTINVLISTNLLSRGFDMHTIKLVINFDVPTYKHLPDYESYLHRIGRAGRFGASGVALTIFDREEDEKNFFEIIDHYTMKDKVKPLDGGAEQLSSVLQQANEDDIL